MHGGFRLIQDGSPAPFSFLELGSLPLCVQVSYSNDKLELYLFLEDQRVLYGYFFHFFLTSVLDWSDGLDVP